VGKADVTRRSHTETFDRPTTEAHEFRLKPFQGVVLEVEDEHFHHDSAVLLPNFPADAREAAGGPSLGLSVLAECLKHQSANPNMKVLVVGHADTSGPDQYNLGISMKRAEAVLHALKRERDARVKIAEGQHKTEDFQLILTWVANVYGWNCDPGGVDNVNGTQTQTAVKNFQKAYNAEFEKKIPEDGVVGHQTWGAFFDVYMDMVENLCETDEPGVAQLRSKMNFIGPKVVGCGENWPIEEPQRPNFRSVINRRVEILFFDPGQEPKLDCHPGAGKCTPLLCEIYNLKMYKFTPLPVNPSPPKPRHCFLKLTYLGPDDKKEFVFPPDFPVTVVWKDLSKHVEKVAKDGLLQFGVPQNQGPFTLAFEAPDTFIATAPDGSADAKPDRTAKAAELKDLHKNSFRFFRVPDAWTLKQSDWTPDAAAKHYDKDNFLFNLPAGRFGKTLGSSAAPEKITLDPHWTYLRFEYFDRYFGHTDHGDKRINIPATLIDGWRTAPAAAKPDTSSHWTVRDADNDKCAHAIPWILQFKEDRTAEPKPDKDVSFGFETDAGTFVIAESATVRKIDVVADKNQLKPSADRLKLYDLPKKWKSQKYYTRFSDGKGEFFDKANTFEDKIKASNVVDTPLSFSLDDIVLADQNKQQVKLTANDKVAIFWNKFVKSAAPKTSDAGVYNPDTANTASYQTNLDMTNKYYIQDYPNWTRLVITQQNMWDNFADRTEEGGSNEVIGARAAVRWVDSPASGPPAGSHAEPPLNPSNMAAGTVTNKDFISIQPFYEGRYSLGGTRYTGAGTSQQGTGRYDMAVLRCCDREDDVEVVFSMHYLRLLFNFGGAPANAPTPQAYMDNVCTNVAARWNGNETGAGAHNTTRTELLPQDSAKKIKGYVLWFLQPVPAALANANTRAHFFIQVTASAGRAFMASNRGYGEFGNNCDAPESGFSAGSYTGAHEVGHGNSLPDEYCERWWGCSWGELSFWCRTPGDPYEPDGRFDPGGGALTQNDSGMMNGVVKPRNRYYWHDAEFTRVATGIPFKVKYDAHDDYKVPPHPQAPKQQYTYWPISDAVNSAQGPRGKSDLLAYTLGKDKYATDILPHSSVANPFDGVLVIQVNMQIFINANMVSAAFGVPQILPLLRSIVGSTLNDKFMATGKVQTGTPQEWEFKKCQIRFSPRFAVTSHVDASDPQYASHLTLMQSIGSHFSVALNHSTAPNTTWNSPTGNALNLDVNLTVAGWQARLQSQFRDRFAEMVGFANAAAITPASLKPVVQKVITTNGDAANIV
jgi:hypothetical protein